MTGAKRAFAITLWEKHRRATTAGPLQRQVGHRREMVVPLLLPRSAGVRKRHAFNEPDDSGNERRLAKTTAQSDNVDRQLDLSLLVKVTLKLHSVKGFAGGPMW
jgi:hypothetical protein